MRDFSSPKPGSTVSCRSDTASSSCEKSSAQRSRVVERTARKEFAVFAATKLIRSEVKNEAASRRDRLLERLGSQAEAGARSNGKFERSDTQFSPRGRRWASAVAKLPSKAPKAKRGIASTRTYSYLAEATSAVSSAPVGAMLSGAQQPAAGSPPVGGETDVHCS